jgi:hypothetical protein
VALYAISHGTSGVEGLAAVGGVALVLVAVVGGWDTGLVAGPVLLLVAYALAAGEGGPLDWVAPLVAVGLLGVVEFGSWSLELRDGAEQRPLARMPSVLLVFGGAVAASTLVLAVGEIPTRAGLAIWALGAAAAVGLFALIARPESAAE